MKNSMGYHQSFKKSKDAITHGIIYSGVTGVLGEGGLGLWGTKPNFPDKLYNIMFKADYPRNYLILRKG